MTNIHDYVDGRSIDEAMSVLEEELVEKIEDTILSEDDEDMLLKISDELGLEIYSMSDLDDVYNHLSPTEVLEELNQINLGDAFFNAEDAESSDNFWDLLPRNYSSKDVVEAIIERDITISALDEVMDRYEEVKEDIRKFYEDQERKQKKIEIARKLFEQMLDDNVDKVIALLNGSKEV